MSTTELTIRNGREVALSTAPAYDASIMEDVMMVGDLSQLKPAQRVNYYMNVCRSLGLNPMTRPFDYMILNGKLTLYAKRECSDQLRSLRGISVRLAPPQYDEASGCYVVRATATDMHGRTDEDDGVVFIKNLSGDARANALMKANTKAKRRVTLSICGLGWLDQSEIETIPGAQRIEVADDGQIAGNAKPAESMERGTVALIQEITAALSLMPEATRQQALEIRRTYGVKRTNDMNADQLRDYKAKLILLAQKVDPPAAPMKAADIPAEDRQPDDDFPDPEPSDTDPVADGNDPDHTNVYCIDCPTNGDETEIDAQRLKECGDGPKLCVRCGMRRAESERLQEPLFPEGASDEPAPRGLTDKPRAAGDGRGRK